MDTQRKFVAFTSADALAVVNGAAAAAGAAVAGTAWVTLDFGPVSSTLPTGDRRKKVALVRVHDLRKTGASGTAHTALVADVTGSAASAWATQYASAAVAAATRLNEVLAQPVPMLTDATGKLFFTPGGDAADTFDYSLKFEVLS